MADPNMTFTLKDEDYLKTDKLQFEGTDFEFFNSDAFQELASSYGFDNNTNITRTHSSKFRMFTEYMDIYIVPLIAFIGLAGNLLSFIVFVCTYMRRLSSSIYLAALSVADSFFLICVTLSWAKHTGVYVYVQDGWCQTFVYMTYVSSFLSVWYVVAFTCERYIVVFFPLRRQDLCTTKRAKIVVSCLALSAVVLYSFGIWTSGVSQIMDFEPVCGPLRNYMDLVDIFNNIDTVMTLLLPFLAILVMNLKITYKVVLFYREKKSFSLSDSLNGHYRSMMQVNPVSHKTRLVYTRTQVRVTKMLLTVSTIFLVLNLPRHTTRTYFFLMRFLDEGYIPSETIMLWDKIFLNLYYMHFSVNLFLYSMMNKNFRKALVWLGRRIRHSACEVVARYPIPCSSIDKGYTHAQTAEIILGNYSHRKNNLYL